MRTTYSSNYSFFPAGFSQYNLPAIFPSPAGFSQYNLRAIILIRETPMHELTLNYCKANLFGRSDFFERIKNKGKWNELWKMMQDVKLFLTGEGLLLLGEKGNQYQI